MIPNGHLSAEIRARTIRIITQSVTLSGLGRKHQELVVRHVKTELLPDVVVLGGGLVARATGAVEARARVDARRRDVAVVFARERVAGAAGWGTVALGGDGDGRCGGCEEDGDGGELHFVNGVWVVYSIYYVLCGEEVG